MRHRILIVVVHFKEAARRVSGGASLDTRTTEGRRDLDMRATSPQRPQYFIAALIYIVSTQLLRHLLLY